MIPELKGKLDGMAMRVPVPDGSVTDLVCILSRETTAEEINDAFRGAAGEERWTGIMQYTDEAIVSADIVGNPHSLIVDGTVDDGERADGEGDRLVRQRVGLQLPARRRGRAGRRIGRHAGWRIDLGLFATQTSRANACSCGRT